MHKYVPRQPGYPCSYQCPLLPSAPCGSQCCGKGDGFISRSIPAGAGSRAGRAGGAPSAFPLPRAAVFGSPVGAGVARAPGCPADRPSLPAECRSPSCESCFSRDFCMKCKDKFYLYKGQCFRQCPPGTAAQPDTRECQGKQHPHPVPAVPGDVPGTQGSPIRSVPVPQSRASRDRGASGAPVPTRAGPAAASGVWRRGCGRCRRLPGRTGLPAPRGWRPGGAA